MGRQSMGRKQLIRTFWKLSEITTENTDTSRIKADFFQPAEQRVRNSIKSPLKVKGDRGTNISFVEVQVISHFTKGDKQLTS